MTFFKKIEFLRWLRSAGRAIWRYRQPLGLAAVVVVALLALIVAWPMEIEPYLAVDPSPELLDRDGRLLYPLLNSTESWCFVRDLEHISPYMIQATIAVEDQRFYYHPGVDPLAIVRAVWSNLTGGRVVSGASTLPMQVVKLRMKSTSHVWGKLEQAVQAIRLSARVDRDRILWTYLNTVPYGSNIIGCEAAARRYFGKPAAELTIAEAALLAGLPKAPSYYMPLKYPQRAKQRRNLVLRRMFDEGFITRSQYLSARSRPVDAKFYEYPKLSPHLAMAWTLELTERKYIPTTLDYAIQQKTERLVSAAVRETGGFIQNAAAMVVDVSSAEILARVGSAGFLNEAIDGHVDCCVSERSPGSSLKPFTYALAIESNRLYASEILYDHQWDRGLYNPENFDSRYQGLMTASMALKTSRNVPALTVLERVEVEPFLDFLKKLGYSTLRFPPQHYGLGLTLGNCEVRLEEMMAAYCALANIGEYRSLKIRIGRPDAPAVRVLSKGTCLKVYEMLELPLPDEWHKDRGRTVSTQARVCWKTGTSAGYRDAWCFVFNRHYLVGVWFGNNDGSSSNLLVGARVALPLAARIFRSLPQKNTPGWPSIDGELVESTICAVSGLPANTWCKRTKRELFPVTQFLNRTCDMHYPNPGSVGDMMERWPASPQGWDLSAIKIPFVKSEQPKEIRPEKELRILSPPDKSQFVLTGEPEGDKIQLKTSADHTGSIHWYLNGTYLGESSATAPLYLHLTKGDNKLSCMDQTGRIDAVQFTVVSPNEISRSSLKM